MHRCPDCGELCDCHDILLGGCAHCALEDDIEPIGDEMDDYSEDDED